MTKLVWGSIYTLELKVPNTLFPCEIAQHWDYVSKRINRCVFYLTDDAFWIQKYYIYVPLSEYAEVKWVFALEEKHLYVSDQTGS